MSVLLSYIGGALQAETRLITNTSGRSLCYYYYVLVENWLPEYIIMQKTKDSSTEKDNCISATLYIGNTKCYTLVLAYFWLTKPILGKPLI